jgi:hypothetical protein
MRTSYQECHRSTSGEPQPSLLWAIPIWPKSRTAMRWRRRRSRRNRPARRQRTRLIRFRGESNPDSLWQVALGLISTFSRPPISTLAATLSARSQSFLPQLSPRFHRTRLESWNSTKSRFHRRHTQSPPLHPRLGNTAPPRLHPGHRVDDSSGSNGAGRCNTGNPSNGDSGPARDGSGTAGGGHGSGNVGIHGNGGRDPVALDLTAAMAAT